jgi:hypothetical protein
MSTNHEELKKYWDDQCRIVEPILKTGFDSYLKTEASINSAFCKSFIKADSICCIDERIKEEGLHSAGSGIAYILGFLGQANQKTIKQVIALAVEKAVTDFKNFNPTKIFTHEGCGAENLVHGKLLEVYGDDKMDSFTDPSKLGVYWANEMAKMLNIEYAGRLPVEPAAFHIARVIYYDATGLFTHRLVKERKLPEGFVLSRRYMNKEQCMAETNVAIGIATGDHGFGELINASGNSQLLLVGIGNSDIEELSEENIKSELEEIASNYHGKVIVHTMTPDVEQNKGFFSKLLG